MRHELRTPLNHIVGYSEMLEEEAKEQGEHSLIPDLRRINAAGQELLTLINTLEPTRFRPSEAAVRRMRHDLRTPLNSIVGYGEMLQELAEDRRQPGFLPDLQKICSAANRMLAYINESLTLPETQAEAMVVKQDSFLSPSPNLPDAPSGRAIWSPEDPDAPSGRSTRTEVGFLLVVDDNEMSRDMLSRRLRRQGHTVAEAEHGRQALEMARTNRFDLVLLDVMMPEMNGYETLERMKGDDTLRHIPVIMLSAVEELDSVVRCIELGAEDYLPKPFNPVLLRARIGACLEKKRLRDQEVLYLQQIEKEKKRADDLLHVILPEPVVAELKATNMVRPKRYENVAVMFCDIVGFTAYCDGRPPEEVIPWLQRLVEAYEDLALHYNLEKVKTIGDSFMAVGGLLRRVDNPVLNCVRCGLDMIAAAQQMPVRIGINFGPVVAGVVGNRQYLFDLWGDTVNTAARIESQGMAEAVNLSRAAWQQVSEQCVGESLGMVPLKGKGELEIVRFKAFVAP
jgi:CheY-like chemotaxis protein